jgi:hypothetical protein
VLRGRIARASRVRRVGRRVSEMCGTVGVEELSEMETELLEDGDDSGSNRVERIAESFGVSCDVVVVVFSVAISALLKGFTPEE